MEQVLQGNVPPFDWIMQDETCFESVGSYNAIAFLIGQKLRKLG